MARRVLFPIVACSLLLLSSSVTTRTAYAEEQQHCNNKFCSPGEPEFCFEQTGGPDSHCIEAGSTCAWDICD